jgi:hypothetical protein
MMRCGNDARWTAQENAGRFLRPAHRRLDNPQGVIHIPTSHAATATSLRTNNQSIYKTAVTQPWRGEDISNPKFRLLFCSKFLVYLSLSVPGDITVLGTL